MSIIIKSGASGNLASVDASNNLMVNVGAGSVSITGSVAVTGTFWQATQPVSIAAAVTVQQATAANLNATVTGTVAATQSGTWTVQQGGAPWSQNLTQMGGVTLGAPSNYGTSPGAVEVQGVNAFVTNTVGQTTVTPSAANANAIQVAAVYATSLPTLTNGQATALQLSVNGALLTSDTTPDGLPAASNTITAADVASTTTVWADGLSNVTGSPTANSAAVFTVETLTSGSEGEFRIQMTGNLVGTVIVESSLDGTNWFPKPVRLSGTNYIVSTITGASSPLTNFEGQAFALGNTMIRVRCTAYTSGTGTVICRTMDAVNSVLVLNAGLLRDGITQSTVNTIKSFPVGAPTGTDTALVTTTWQRCSYRAATAALFVAPAATTIFFAFFGSATKTIRVQRIVVSGLNSGTLGIDRLNLMKCSSAPATGTLVALTQVPLDTNYPAATASLCQVYTAAPGTAPTKVGDVASRSLICKSTTAAEGAQYAEETFDFRAVSNCSEIVLRGTAQGIALYFNVAPGAAPNTQVEIEWTEE